MTSIIVFLVLATLLFFGAYISKRRFGLLGLALTAGATLSTIWDYNASLLVSATGLVPSGPFTTAVTLGLIVLLPAVVLLFHGESYKSVIPRIIGSLMFTLLALAFLAHPLGLVLPLEGASADVYNWLNSNKSAIISIGVVLAVVDLFFTKPAALTSRGRKK